MHTDILRVECRDVYNLFQNTSSKQSVKWIKGLCAIDLLQFVPEESQWVIQRVKMPEKQVSGVRCLPSHMTLASLRSGSLSYEATQGGAALSELMRVNAQNMQVMAVTSPSI